MHCAKGIKPWADDFISVVLLIEDEALILLLSEAVLRAAGYETRIAGSVKEAERIITSEPGLDAVVTDVCL